MSERLESWLIGGYLFMGAVHFTLLLHFVRSDIEILCSIFMSMVWPLVDMYFMWSFILHSMGVVVR